ncbi:putative cystathionine beta-lyase [Sporobolomyces salmoneus]|uniref:putative cystathionine beta-lyase n=1 Tax=Sporobolomyces salmoneus TaxID=183962 RepID=UPI003176A1D2
MDSYSLATKGIHSDHRLAGVEVSANISVSTTFKHPDPEDVAAKPEGYYDTAWQANEPSRDIYSREGQPTLTRAEKVLEGIIGKPTLVYPSGLNAFYSLLLHVNPDVVAIGTKDGPGYHGCHGALDVYLRTRKLDESTAKIFIDDDFPTDGRKVLCWLETPLNPTGESYSIESYAKKIHAIPGGVLGIDSTFAPPPLQDPFKNGANIVMHSGTKYFAGHSDTLIGSLSVRTTEEWLQLWSDRTYCGGVPGSLDAWLLLRSLRTLNIRIQRQSKTATALARWLNSLTAANHANSGEEEGNGTKGIVHKVFHTSLQDNANDLLAEDGSKQMTGGPACFGVLLEKEVYAEYLGSRLQLFFNATSLGGVESLIEQRKISDSSCDPRLVRLSIGLEDLEDLKQDFRQAFVKVAEIEKTQSKKP